MYQLLAFRQAGSITSNLSDESNGGMGCTDGCTVLASGDWKPSLNTCLVRAIPEERVKLSGVSASRDWTVR